jgi:GNAT superfamily N-acetyltransferase
MIRIAFFTGAALAAHLGALAQLRLVVFREWPYLYDGSLETEQRHLDGFAASPAAGIAVAFDGETPVGCATCLPLIDADAAIQAPFHARGWEPSRFFYFAESTLLAPYRGQGIGVAFFREREAHARRALACDYACFCAVQRPDQHPLRPAGAKRLDEFWRHRGYTPRPDLVAQVAWKQIDSADKVANRLTFWIKSLTGAALP